MRYISLPGVSRPAMVATQVFDAILAELGDFGRYQARQYALIALPVLFCSAFTITYVFTAGQVPHRCLVPQCGDVDESSPFLPPWLDLAVPPNNRGDGPSSCFTYTPLDNNGSTSKVPDTCSFDNSSRRRCDEWVFDGRERTILTEFSLTCPERAWMLTLVGTINSAGQLVGLPFSGYLSDRHGRKTALVVTLLGSSVLGIARAFSPNYETFLTLEFLEATFTSGTYGIAFILGMELVGPKRRVLGGAVIVWSYALGVALLGVLAWWLRGWRLILLSLYTPALLFVLYIWLIPKSVRWLMSRGRLTEARRLIRRAASVNRVELSAALVDDLDKWQDGQSVEPGSEEDGGEEPVWTALKEVARSRTLLLRLANCSFCWVTNTLVYYGLSLNSVSLAGTDDMYLNFVLVSLVEAPAYILAWLGMTRIGRRRTLCTALIVSGVACLANPFVPQEAEWAQLPLYLVGKLAIAASFDTLYVFTAELFPTRLRTSLLNTCSMVGRVGSMLAPQTPLLGYFTPLLPMLLFGAVALVSGLLALLFPETLGRSLPDSVAEAEALAGAGHAPLESVNQEDQALPEPKDRGPISVNQKDNTLPEPKDQGPISGSLDGLLLIVSPPEPKDQGVISLTQENHSLTDARDQGMKDL